MAFQQDFNTLLNGILTDYRNQLPDADLSQGSLLFIKSACIASAMWGIYQHQEYIHRQMFPDTCAPENLEHHAWVRGLTKLPGETDAALLVRLLDYIRRPPAGGNKYDYIKWAMSVTDVAAAYCYPLAQGDGSVDVVVVANKTTTGSEIPTQGLLDSVAAYINDVRPVTHSQLRILAPVADVTNVTMVITGAGINIAQVAAEITSMLSGMAPGQSLYRVQLTSIAVNGGATNVVITAPAADIIPAGYHMIRPGVINVT